MNPELKHFLPFKSVAIALLFSILFGPLGVLYSTVSGGIVMIVIGFIVICDKFMVPLVLVWLLSCIVSVIAVNRYNKRIWLERNKSN